jgi:hypothetical protein
MYLYISLDFRVLGKPGLTPGVSRVKLGLRGSHNLNLTQV